MTTTKKELLNIAKAMNIAGRYEMTKDELDRAIAAKSKANHDAGVEAQASTEDNLTGGYIYTAPFQVRMYQHTYTNPEVYASLAPQAKKIFDFMAETKIIATGEQVVKSAIEAGKLKTAQNHAVLYAFYARKLEDAGIRLVVC
jgi:hypothetical protein